MEAHGIEETRGILGDLVERVRVGGEHFVITRYGKPAAVIVPVEWLEQMKARIGSEKVAS
jgi:prevent-host-death family protein